MRKQIDIRGRFEIEYDPESPEFKESLESYREAIDRDGTEDTMLQHVAHNVVRAGSDSMVEGVGYVRTRNQYSAPRQPFSGITIEDDYDQFEYEIL